MSSIIKSGKGIGNPRWEYIDSKGIKHFGWVDRSTDFGGTDVSYFFRDENTNELSIVSGGNLKHANRIWK